MCKKSNYIDNTSVNMTRKCIKQVVCEVNKKQYYNMMLSYCSFNNYY